MTLVELIDGYRAGPGVLLQAIEGMSPEQWDAKPIVGAWSTRQVVCHIADFELVYADRMKRVIAEEEPSFFGGDPDQFAGNLAYEQRDLHEEIRLVAVTRQHMARILASLSEVQFGRMGKHMEEGPLSLKTLLHRIVDHIPHHVRFIDAKRQKL